MCVNGAISVLDRILWDGLILLYSLPPIRVVLIAPLVTKGLPYISLHLVICERLSIWWWFKTEELYVGLPEIVQSIPEPMYEHLFEGPTASLLILRSLESVVFLQLEANIY